MHFLAMDRASGRRHARVVSSDAVTGAQLREILCWSRAATVQSDRFHTSSYRSANTARVEEWSDLRSLIVRHRLNLHRCQSHIDKIA